MKRLNLKVVLLSSCVSTVLLFGGWFIYQYTTVDQPLYEWLETQDGLDVADLHVSQDSVQVQVKFQDPQQFVALYYQFKEKLELVYQDKQIEMNIVPEQNEWNEWWGAHAAPIFEAVTNRQYTQVEEILSTWQAEEVISDFHFSMNQEEMFIYLHPVVEDGIYVILPINEWDVTARTGR